MSDNNLTVRQRLLRSLENTIKSVERGKDTIEYYNPDLIKQCFPEARISIGFCPNIDVDLPADFALIEMVKTFMSVQFPKAVLSSENQFIWSDQNKGGIFLRYYSDPDYLTIEWNFRTETKGSVCVLNKIGEETKILPVYELVCGAQAAAEFPMPEEPRYATHAAKMAGVTGSSGLTGPKKEVPDD